MNANRKTASIHHIKTKPALTVEVQNPATERNIITTYFQDSTKMAAMKVNRSKYSRSAVMRAVDHMTMNTYEAMVAEVYDDEYGCLHAQIVRDVTGKITIVFLRDPTKPEVAITSKDQFGSFSIKKSKRKPMANQPPKRRR